VIAPAIRDAASAAEKKDGLILWFNFFNTFTLPWPASFAPENGRRSAVKRTPTAMSVGGRKQYPECGTLASVELPIYIFNSRAYYKHAFHFYPGGYICCPHGDRAKIFAVSNDNRTNINQQ
jgi:hypothetical protein